MIYMCIHTLFQLLPPCCEFPQVWADQQRAGWVGQGSADQPDQTEHNDEEQNTSLGSMAWEELRKEKKE